MIKTICFMVLGTLALFSAAYSGTFTLQGDFVPLMSDIIVLDSAAAERTISYDIGPYLGDDFRFEVRCLNLDTLNWQFGDTVTEGAFEIFGNGINFGSAANIRDASFVNRDWPVPPEAIVDTLAIRIALGIGSDAVALYKPRLLITDSIAPAPVADLAAVDSFNTLLLTWTAPGDDGSSHLATAYEIRYSSAPVESDTAAWWQSAAAVVGLQSPSGPGFVDSLRIYGLDTNTTYYIVLVTFDELGNRSGYSNVASATTSVPHGNFCLRYDGDRYAEVPFDPLLNTGNQLTIEAWFYLDDSYTWNHAAIIDKPGPSGAPPFYQYNMGPANHTDFYAHVAINGNYSPFELYNVVQTDIWTHAAVTYDGNYRFVYLDGVPVDSVLDPGQLDSFDSNVRIGALGNFEVWFFKGFIDELRIWNVARTGAEINQCMHHRLAGDEQNLVAYWDFDDGIGQAFADRSPNHINGYLGNSDSLDARDPIWVPSSAPVDTLVVEVVDGSSGLPDRVSIEPGYPNPFNAGTRIGFALPAPAHVDLAVFDMLGRRVKTLADESFGAGRHSIEWDGSADDGRAASSGIYFYRMKSGDFEAAQKLVMVK